MATLKFKGRQWYEIQGLTVTHTADGSSYLVITEREYGMLKEAIEVNGDKDLTVIVNGFVNMAYINNKSIVIGDVTKCTNYDELVCKGNVENITGSERLVTITHDKEIGTGKDCDEHSERNVLTVSGNLRIYIQTISLKGKALHISSELKGGCANLTTYGDCVVYGDIEELVPHSKCKISEFTNGK